MKNLNQYSELWYELFLETRPYTHLEMRFLQAQLPNPPYGRILDVCCGSGRHANLLAAAGYAVTGIDLNEAALARARAAAPASATYLAQDMRRLGELNGRFDAVLCLWQSFGYFDAATNADILRQISNKLRANGRFILDIYNRDAFTQSSQTRRLEKNGLPIRIVETMTGNRLTATVTYGDEGGEQFSWELYTLAEIETLASQAGLNLISSCAYFDAETAVASNKNSMQLIFEKFGH